MSGEQELSSPSLSVQEDIVMLSSRRTRQADERVTKKRRSSMLTETDV